MKKATKRPTDKIRMLELRKELAELHEEMRKVKNDNRKLEQYRCRSSVALATVELAVAQFREGQ